MNKEHLLLLTNVIGIIIMLLAFLVVPDIYPWYYEVLLFDVGLALVLIVKWYKFKQQISKKTKA